MILILLLGDSILRLFGGEAEAFALAGALILFAMTLEMILGVELFKDATSGKTVSIFPLAFPIIARAVRKGNTKKSVRNYPFSDCRKTLFYKYSSTFERS